MHVFFFFFSVPPVGWVVRSRMHNGVLLKVHCDTCVRVFMTYCNELKIMGLSGTSFMLSFDMWINSYNCM
jgi:hypothetical protein